MNATKAGISCVGSFVLGLSCFAADPAPKSREGDETSDVVRVQAMVYHGDFVGFQVFPGRKRELFSCLGMEPRDLIQSVDGSPLKLPYKEARIDLITRELMQALQSRVVKLHVLRGKLDDPNSKQLQIQTNCKLESDRVAG